MSQEEVENRRSNLSGTKVQETNISAKQARHAALSELRSALTGKAQRWAVPAEEEEDVYDVVTEDQYKELWITRKDNVRTES